MAEPRTLYELVVAAGGPTAVARRCRLSSKTVSDVANGCHPPALESAARLADGLGELTGRLLIIEDVLRLWAQSRKDLERQRELNAEAHKYGNAKDAAAHA